ncbi:MAG: hypothetical protein LAT57_00845 [Balneolales bacterium]|nr:hypothetical protein [Balneolales bacterium]
MAEVRRKKKRLKTKRRRSGSQKKQTKRLIAIIGTGLLVVLVVAGLLMKRVLDLPLDDVTEPTPTVQAPAASQPLSPRLEPLLNIARTYAPDDPDAATPARALPDNILLIPQIDINADGIPETLTATLRDNGTTLDRRLSRAGFSGIVTKLIISQGEETILRVDEYAIRDSQNRIIIDQVPATYGYAFRMYEFEDEYDETPFDRPVSVFDLVIVDEFGRGMSDEITIYWKPSTSRIAATNTFGAPGTF